MADTNIIGYAFFIILYIIVYVGFSTAITSIKKRECSFLGLVIVGDLVALEVNQLLNILLIFMLSYSLTKTFNFSLFFILFIASNIGIMLTQIAKLFVKNPEAAFIRSSYNSLRFMFFAHYNLTLIAGLIIIILSIIALALPLYVYMNFNNRLSDDQLYTLIIGVTFGIYLVYDLFSQSFIFGSLLSEYLDNDARNLTFISILGRVSVWIFYFYMMISSLSLLNLPDSIKDGLKLANNFSSPFPPFISPLLVAFIALISCFCLMPYIVGWFRSKEKKIEILDMELKYMSYLLNLFIFPTPNTYSPKLINLSGIIEKSRVNLDSTMSQEKKVVLEKMRSFYGSEFVKSLKSSYDDNPQHLIRCYQSDVLEKIQNDIAESVLQISKCKNDEEIINVSKLYCKAYSDRREQINEKIDYERKRSPLLLLIATFIITPIILAILDGLGGIILKLLFPPLSST
jgi:hypothetical protein